MPMILAGCGALGSIWDKRLLLITEGQWDGLTLALTAGWYDEALGLLAIPDHVAMSHCAALVAGRNGLRLTSHT